MPDTNTGSHCECVHDYGGLHCDTRKMLLLFPYSLVQVINAYVFEHLSCGVFD